MTKGLSIDPNSKETGLVYWDGDAVAHAMTLRSDDPEVGGLPHPYLTMAHMLMAEVMALKRPDWVAVEGVYLGKNPRVYAQLNRILGCIELAAHRQGLRYHELSTAVVDRGCNLPYYAAGKRKEATQYFAYQNGHGDMDEHQADAFCVGFVIATQERRRELIEEAERKSA